MLTWHSMHSMQVLTLLLLSSCQAGHSARGLMSTQQGSVSTTCLHPAIAILQRSDTRQVLVWATAALEEPDQWLLRAAGFWNSLASLPRGNVFRHVALDACSAAVSQDHRNWAHSMFKAMGHRISA